MRLIFVFLTLLLSACHPSQKLFRYHKVMMTMDLRLQIPQKNGVEQLVQNVFQEVDQHYNNWNPSSEISQINKAPAHRAIPLSNTLEKLLLEVDQLYTLLEGRFDPTVGPLVCLWKEHLKQGKIPDKNTLQKMASCCGWHHISIKDHCLTKNVEGIEIDLCAIAKGYAVDRLIDHFKARGFPWAYVEWGGEIRTLGRHPEGRAWQIALENGKICALEDKGLATSGSYWQTWSVDKKTYTHIINPKTAYPVEVTSLSPKSCCVCAESCSKADAIATALMCFSNTLDAYSWAKTHLEGPVWINSDS